VAKQNKILVIGATGQIGSELTPALRKRVGGANVLAAGHAREPDENLTAAGPCCTVDVRDLPALTSLVVEHGIDTIYHLGALLSAVAEARPQLAWDINVNGLMNVLEVARLHGCAVFFPSSIGAFGPSTPGENTPQDTIQRPNTMYGVTKLTGELLCDYYHQRFGVDTRGVRYPGLISHRTLPGGGTTDYAVHIFYAALKEGHYDCFLEADTRLDMMYMPDAVRAAIELMEADGGRLIHRNAYNVTAMSFAPADLANEIVEHVAHFTIGYSVDPVRQAIADSWPRHMDDSAARREWGWQPEFDLAATVEAMLAALRSR
jgi:nucleoside-diphosphate-sugar epimerase